MAKHPCARLLEGTLSINRLHRTVRRLEAADRQGSLCWDRVGRGPTRPLCGTVGVSPAELDVIVDPVGRESRIGHEPVALEGAFDPVDDMHASPFRAGSLDEPANPHPGRRARIDLLASLREQRLKRFSVVQRSHGR